MASKSKAKSNRKEAGSYHARSLRRNQIIFSVFAVILIISMALSVAVYLK